ncbi:MAG: flagellar FliJ family protein [Planctomycetota bacterium]
MKRFSFRLDPVLQLRRRTEEQHLRTVATIEQERRKLEDQLRGQQSRITQSKSAWSASLIGPLDMHTLRSQAHGSLDAVRTAQQLAIQLAGVHRRLRDAREQLNEAIRARRAIELLRDKAMETWQAEGERAETAMLDDVSNAMRQMQDEVL